MAETEESAPRLPHMRLYVNDILSDPEYQALTTEMKGAYDQLLFRGWQMGASLPDDDDQLRSWAGLSRAKWEKNRARIMSFFAKNLDGRWEQKRQVFEYGKAIEEYEKKRKGGQTAGRGRPKPIGKQKDTYIDSDSSPLGKHTGLLKQSESEPALESESSDFDALGIEVRDFILAHPSLTWNAKYQSEVRKLVECSNWAQARQLIAEAIQHRASHPTSYALAMLGKMQAADARPKDEPTVERDWS